jgi:hypothetical protein
MCQRLAAAHAKGALQFFADHTALHEADAFRAFLKPLRRVEWVVYAKRPFAGPDQVLSYLARSTHRVAIANSRLLAFDEKRVSPRHPGPHRASGADSDPARGQAPADGAHTRGDCAPPGCGTGDEVSAPP